MSRSSHTSTSHRRALASGLFAGLVVTAAPPAGAAKRVAHVGVGFPRMLSAGVAFEDGRDDWYGVEIGAHWPGFFGPGASGRLFFEHDIWGAYGVGMAANAGVGGGVLWLPDCLDGGACEPTGAAVIDTELLLKGGGGGSGMAIAVGLSLWYIGDDGDGPALAALPSARIGCLFF